MLESERTAIITGAGKRVGAVLAERLKGRGWTVLGHVRRIEDAVPDGVHKVAADLSLPCCAERIFAAAAGLPPVRLLVNNAARFAFDGFGCFSTEEFDAHMAINLRAPLLLSEAFAAVHDGQSDGMIVNILDAKLSAPNPDFLSYTLSKQGLAGFTQLAARAHARQGIRVNGIAPALMLRSGGQSQENFEKEHSRNPLQRGVEPDHVMQAIDYLLSTPTVTGQVLTIDAGQHFIPPERDVQFLED